MNPILRFCADAARISLSAAEYARSKGWNDVADAFLKDSRKWIAEYWRLKAMA